MYNDVNPGQMCFKRLELYVKVFLEPSFLIFSHLFSMSSFLAFGFLERYLLDFAAVSKGDFEEDGNRRSKSENQSGIKGDTKNHLFDLDLIHVWLIFVETLILKCLQISGAIQFAAFV